ncbi:MAG TPA: hybrid sensor histidine kinase/response regulator [Steroidobacteraceae bacterium]|nr:hybrid sensor histidine kinase/response regulator [Steroidobacteraceae bacterium]
MTALPQYVDHFLDAYTDALDNTTDTAMVVTDETNAIVYANAAAAALFGYEKSALVKQPLNILWSRNEQPQPASLQQDKVEWCAHRSDGTSFSIAVQSRVVSTAAGEFNCSTVHCTGTDENNDDEGNDQESGRDALLALNEETLRVRNTFIAATAHDLRQPLQTLQIINATLQRKITDVTIQAVLREEQKSIAALSELLDALLSISKLESGKVSVNRQEVSMGRLFDDLYAQFESQAHARGLALVFNTDDALSVTTDRGLLFDLLQNLITNAIRYTDHGSIEVLCRSNAGDGIIIEVIDSGIGIPEEALPKIWDDFYQVAIPHRGGSGLGLGIVKRIATLLQIGIEVSSVAGRGTSFTVEIQGAYRSVEAVPDNVSKAFTNRNHGGDQIIMVEDNEAVRAATSTYLELDGYDVHSAGSLQEVDDLLDSMQLSPVIVISDFRLRGNELGSSAIAKIRAKYGAALPAIVLTGDTSAVPASLASESHTRIMSKPIDARLLTSAMNDLLEIP